MFMLGVSTLITVILIPAGQPFAFQGGAAGALNATFPLQFTNAVLATHSTKGVVKSIDDNTLVITRSVRRGKEMTFELDSTTLRALLTTAVLGLSLAPAAAHAQIKDPAPQHPRGCTAAASYRFAGH